MLLDEHHTSVWPGLLSAQTRLILIFMPKVHVFPQGQVHTVLNSSLYVVLHQQSAWQQEQDAWAAPPYDS